MTKWLWREGASMVGRSRVGNLIKALFFHGFGGAEGEAFAELKIGG